MDPSLILVKDIVGKEIIFLPILSALPVIVSSVIGIVCLAGGVEGYLIDECKIYERLLLGVAALTLLNPGLVSDIIGLAALVIVYILQKRRVGTQEQAV